MSVKQENMFYVDIHICIYTNMSIHLSMYICVCTYAFLRFFEGAVGPLILGLCHTKMKSPVAPHVVKGIVTMAHVTPLDVKIPAFLF